MLKKLIEKNKSVSLLDNKRSAISKKEIKKFKAEANLMKKQFRDISKFDLGINL